jgi:hypothetical protein
LLTVFTLIQTLNSLLSVCRKINAIELRYLISFLGLLKQVATFSTAARMTLFENQGYRALESISGLLVCPVSSDLKASLFECVTAFCVDQEVGGLRAIGNQQAEIRSSVWLMFGRGDSVCKCRGLKSLELPWLIDQEILSSEEELGEYRARFIKIHTFLTNCSRDLGC